VKPVRYAGTTLVLLVLAGSAVLTTARLLTPGGHFWVLATSFVPWALVGYLVAGVGCGLLCWRANRRWLPLVGVLLAAAGLVVHASWLAPDFAASPAPSGDRLTILTQNLQIGRGDPDAVVRLARRVQPDVIVLEETTPEALQSLEARQLGAGRGEWPHRLGSAAPGASGTVVLSRYPLEADPGSPLGDRDARMRVLAPRPFTLTAVHTTYPMILVDRWKQDFDALVADARGSEGPQLFVGDFNATLDHGPMRRLLAQGLTDAAEDAGSGWQPTWPRPGAPTFRGLSSPLRLMAIDHVLMSKELAAASTRTYEVPDTDHLALVARVGWR
jgi:endonuclease/exonuclease/phosphatase (EEP) superfamily protein YafD